MKEKILITGASGFVGFYITALLANKGYSITAFCRQDSPGLERLKTISPGINILLGDLHDYETLNNCTDTIDIIIHAAAKVEFNPSFRDQVHKTNVEGTAQLINLCIEKGIKRFIQISSVSALGGIPDQQEFDESATWDIKGDHNIYAISKHLAELEVWRGAAEGLEVCLLCPSVVIGRWNRGHHSMEPFETVRRSIPFYPPGSTGVVDVRDVAHATLCCIEQNIHNERIILNGHNLSLKEMMDKSADLLNTKKPRYRLHYTPVYWGAKIISWGNKLIGKKFRIPSAVVKSLFNRSSYDATKSKKLLGIEYRNIEETLKWTLVDGNI